MPIAPPYHPAVSDPMKGYAIRPDRYDECRAPDGSLRPHWAEFFRLLGPDPTSALRHATEACSRAIIEQDVSMNVYSGERSGAQPWPLDAVPQIVSAEDWNTLSTGLRQRAHLYNQLLTDLYGPQRLLRNGMIPSFLAMANPRFLRPCVGLAKRGGVFLHTYAVDIARSPDGGWWVLQDRLDSPSGLGYSIQNRTIARRVLPQVFHRAPVHRLYEFLRDFRLSVQELTTSRGNEVPRVVFLTPGPANETYFEQAYLARYLGYPLVEGADLTTRDRQVFLRTVGGLKRVDAIVRRVDSAFCDPLELHAHSLLGVPGLVHVAQGGRVAITNQLGSSALESPALLSFLAPLCRSLMGEELKLPGVATWWCGQKKARDYVLKNLANLVVKPTFRERGASTTRYGPLLNGEELSKLADSIAARPWAHCGQERVLLGTTPGWRDHSLQPVPFVMRLFVAWQNGDYHVMPGGLTRFSTVGEDAIVSLQQGSMTKDIWVLSDAPVDDSRISLSVFPDLHHRTTATPSRLADHLFWLGRYLNRTAQIARLLDKLDPLLRDEVSALDPGVTTHVIGTLLAAQDIDEPEDATPDELVAHIRLSADDTSEPGSLASNLSQLIRNLEQVKLRLPPESWRILRRLRTISNTAHPQLASDLSEQLSALEAMAMDMLAHDTGWHFLTLGRRIERALQLVFITSRLIATNRPTEFRLQTALHFSESLFTYRSIHPGGFQPATVLSWLIAAVENPRSLRFQADHITEHLAALPDELAPRDVAALRATAFRLVSQVRLLEVSTLAASPEQSAAFFAEAHATLSDLSNQLTLIYFSHSEIPAPAVT
ncbi:MAG: circularly permuted type 2 ATP-grasp protein [Opitutus sp.]